MQNQVYQEPQQEQLNSDDYIPRQFERLLDMAVPGQDGIYPVYQLNGKFCTTSGDNRFGLNLRYPSGGLIKFEINWAVLDWVPGTPHDAMVRSYANRGRQISVDCWKNLKTQETDADTIGNLFSLTSTEVTELKGLIERAEAEGEDACKMFRVRIVPIKPDNGAFIQVLLTHALNNQGELASYPLRIYRMVASGSKAKPMWKLNIRRPGDIQGSWLNKTAAPATFAGFAHKPQAPASAPAAPTFGGTALGEDAVEQTQQPAVPQFGGQNVPY